MDLEELVEYFINKNIVDGDSVCLGLNLVNDNEYIKDKSILMKYEDEKTIKLFDQIYNKLGVRGSVSLPANFLNCFAMARNSVVINPDGFISKCNFAKPYGTVYEPDVYDHNLLYYSQIRDPFNKKECLDCSVFPLCYGGCDSDNTTICIIKHLISSKIKRYFNNELIDNHLSYKE